MTAQYSSGSTPQRVAGQAQDGGPAISATMAIKIAKANPATVTFSGYTTGSGTTSVTLTTVKVKGVVDASQAAAGDVGEVISSIVVEASAVNIPTSGVDFDLTTMTLSAGDWDIWGSIVFLGAASTVFTYYAQAAITTASGNLGTREFAGTGAPNGVSQPILGVPVMPQQFNVNTSTPVYLVGNLQFTTSTASACGFMTARRRR